MITQGYKGEVRWYNRPLQYQWGELFPILHIYLTTTILDICICILLPITSHLKVAHKSHDTDLELIRSTRELFDFLPLSNREAPPQRATTDNPDRLIPSFKHIIPSNQSTPYDMKNIVENLVDDRHFYELMPDWAQNIIIGFGERLNQYLSIDLCALRELTSIHLHLITILR